MAQTLEFSHLTDGLETLRAEFDLSDIAHLIEKTAKWVHPETFRLLPVWFPEHARGQLLYKGNWTAPQTNTNRSTKQTVHKREGNMFASRALDWALGIQNRQLRPNWSCCHIWGVDDPHFQKPNTVVSDHRFFSCVANMVLLPTPLKAFTDAMPEIKAMLRICSSNLYGWRCDHPDIEDWKEPSSTDSEFWQAYPESWPKTPKHEQPMGLSSLSPFIKRKAKERKASIFRDLESAGDYYPRENVLAVLEYWKIRQ